MQEAMQASGGVIVPFSDGPSVRAVAVDFVMQEYLKRSSAADPASRERQWRRHPSSRDRAGAGGVPSREKHAVPVARCAR
jgi:hypothetical protein